jgi:hypothetical protein
VIRNNPDFFGFDNCNQRKSLLVVDKVRPSCNQDASANRKAQETASGPQIVEEVDQSLMEMHGVGRSSGTIDSYQQFGLSVSGSMSALCND